VASLKQFDLANTPLRDVNRFLHREAGAAGVTHVKIANADGAHSIAAGCHAPLTIDVEGHAGYYLGGMNMHANITVHGNAGPGVGENMMSGSIRVTGFASTAAGASAHGGLLVIHGDAALRCGISLKGGDIVVGGDVGSFSAFMAQAGRIVVCGDAGDALGDSLYEAVIYVRGQVRSLGADARFEPMQHDDYDAVRELLGRARLAHDPKEFRRVASAKTLYHWNADADQQY
jgi:methylamine---glutamate N-methyltransferase subunit B